ncbi:MAG TPA: BBP7 family outer membrane beta-barrel protein [Gemmataceae bacterium]|nr:BBP7 family outer membrane beta-barrel protein [Gemmataceae bacterium]
MRWTLKAGFALALGLLVGGARAQEGRPIATSAPSVPAAALERPVAAGAAATPIVDPQVRPTTFAALGGFRAPDARPLPVGPAASGVASAPVWTRNDVVETAPPPTPLATPAPGPISSGPLVPAPAVGGPISSGPVGPPAFPDGCDAACGPGGPFCGNSCFNGCDNGCPRNRAYVSAEYLLWATRGSPVPPLVTQGVVNPAISAITLNPANQALLPPGSPPISTLLGPGSLGLPGTQTLFGGRDVNTGVQSGFRLMAGYWFTDDHLLGFEAGGFILGQQTSRFGATSFGDPILARPFTDAFTGIQTSEAVANPALVGAVNASVKSQLWGGEANLRSNLCCNCWYSFDLLAGFRIVGLDDSLEVNESLRAVMGPDAGSTFAIQDRFSVNNRFYGGQIGAIQEFRRGNWFVDLTTKVALGTTQQIANISGSSFINGTGFAGGLLAQPTNIGSHTRDVFGVVPEVGLTVGYRFNDHWRAFAGYNFLYWNNVARAGNLVNPVVNQNQLPPPVTPLTGPAQPLFHFTGSEYWAQGVTFGLEFRY